MTEETMDQPSNGVAIDGADTSQAAMLEEFAEQADEGAASSDRARGPARGGIDDLTAMFDVPVRVQAVLGRARMPIGELLRMRTGMVIELDRKIGEPVDIFVNDRLIARGEVVLIEDSLGITLTEIVQQDR